MQFKKFKKVLAIMMAAAVTLSSATVGVSAATNSKVTATYKQGMTFVDEEGTELSVEDAKTAVDAGKTVKVYTKTADALFGSYTARGTEAFRMVYLLGANGVNKTYSLGSAVDKTGTVDGTTISGMTINSTSDNLNPVVVNANDEKTTVKATIKDSTINLLGKSDGNNDVCDFDAWGIGIAAFGNTVTSIENVKIKTTGVGRTAVESDNGADVFVKNSDIDVEGGEVYSGYRCTAIQTKMVNPPWVLGITGYARATNLLGPYSTMTVADSNVYADSWGVLSTDACTEPSLYAIDSTLSLNTSGDDLTKDTGYITYAIGGSDEYFLGTTINASTMGTICANGENKLTYGASNGNIAITKHSASGATSTVDTVKGKGQKTTLNSENFGVDIWSGGTVTVKEGTTFNTGDAAFLVKTGDNAFLGAHINIDNSTINSKTGVLLQVFDNEDAVAEGVEMGDGGPYFDKVTYSEKAGYQGVDNDTVADNTKSTVTSSEVTKYTNDLTITNATINGNVYNSSGYKGNASDLKVTLGDKATLTGVITAGSYKHSTDQGKTQNTLIDISKYYQVNHIWNIANYNGSNLTGVELQKGATWNVTGTSYVTELKVAEGATLNGTVYDANGKQVTIEAGKKYVGLYQITAKGAAAPAALKDKAVKSETAAGVQSGDHMDDFGAPSGGGEAGGNDSTAAAPSYQLSALTGLSFKNASTIDSIEKTAAGTYKITAAAATVNAPTVKAAAKAGKKAAFSWKAMKGANKYIVQYSTSKKFTAKTTTTVKTTATKATVKGLKAGTKYYVRVQAVNGAAKSSYSAVKTITAKK